MCATVGGTVGSLVPMLWGSSGMSLGSFAFGTIGGVLGLVFGARLTGV